MRRRKRLVRGFLSTSMIAPHDPKQAQRREHFISPAITTSTNTRRFSKNSASHDDEVRPQSHLRSVHDRVWRRRVTTELQHYTTTQPLSVENSGRLGVGENGGVPQRSHFLVYNDI